MSVDTINQRLAEMRAAGKVLDIKAKGAAGEAAALDVVHGYRTKHGGILKSGYMYPYASNRQNQIYLGNIFWDEEKQRFYDVTRQLNDEIDILYISHYRVFAIEIKAYHDDTIVITNEWMERQGRKVDKSPLAQAEKHARHLYHQLYDVLPFGDPRYICPLVCFVDRSTIDDRRSAEMRYYLPAIPLNWLKQTLLDYDRPVDGTNVYTLDLEMIEKKLKSIERERDL